MLLLLIICKLSLAWMVKAKEQASVYYVSLLLQAVNRFYVI